MKILLFWRIQPIKHYNNAEKHKIYQQRIRLFFSKHCAALFLSEWHEKCATIWHAVY